MTEQLTLKCLKSLRVLITLTLDHTGVRKPHYSVNIHADVSGLHEIHLPDHYHRSRDEDEGSRKLKHYKTLPQQYAILGVSKLSFQHDHWLKP